MNRKNHCLQINSFKMNEIAFSINFAVFQKQLLTNHLTKVPVLFVQQSFHTQSSLFYFMKLIGL